MKPLVVIGDSILDVDVDGSANRLCPEAPVPVVDVECHWHRPGGAALAAALATRDGPPVVLVTALGDDEAGRRLTALLAPEVRVVNIGLDGTTARKSRVRADGQALTRLDEGDGRARHGELSAAATEAIESAGAVLVADYGRGVTCHPLLRRLITALAAEVPVVWDPHPAGAIPVPGVALVCPNESEAARFDDGRPPVGRADRLRQQWDCGAVAITCGARGAELAAGADRVEIPVPGEANVVGHTRPDTCGAGDRFAAMAAASLRSGESVPHAVYRAVDAAARFVAAGGATSVSVPASELVSSGGEEDAFALAARIRRHGGRLVATGGCFDLLHPGHLALLHHARSLGDALVVCINSDESVRRLKGPSRPVIPATGRAMMLAGLAAVDSVAVFEEPTPVQLLERLRPHIWVKGGDYVEEQLPEAAVVRRHGGRIMLAPHVAGYSTTGILAAAGG
jgi:D-beta-D-heptose 7-phosphate kinase/D-beta-D-heptose 1-phosphate adenosyltransferase